MELCYEMCKGANSNKVLGSRSLLFCMFMYCYIVTTIMFLLGHIDLYILCKM